MRHAPSARAQLLDVLAVGWVVLWIVAATLLGSAAWGLASVTDAARSAASAVDEAGTALEDLGDLPLVPDATSDLGGSIRDRGASIDAQALAARSSIHRVAVGLGASVFLAATAPVWLVHLPLRARRRRAIGGVLTRLDGRAAGAARSAGSRGGTGGDAADDHRAVAAYLAHRAVATMPPARLLAISPDPAGDLAAGRHDALARAEMGRLGIDPRLLRAPAPAPAPTTALPPPLAPAPPGSPSRPGERW